MVAQAWRAQNQHLQSGETGQKLECGQGFIAADVGLCGCPDLEQEGLLALSEEPHTCWETFALNIWRNKVQQV